MEIKEISEYLGIELGDEDNLDTFKNKFSTSFIRKDRAAEDEDVLKAVMGKQTREYATEIKRVAKESESNWQRKKANYLLTTF